MATTQCIEAAARFHCHDSLLIAKNAIIMNRMWSPLRKKLKRLAFGAMPSSHLLVQGPTARKCVALTFDDGPCLQTISYLDLLDELNVPATFFVVGNRVEQYPEIMREYVRRGHQVAGHGYDHQRFTTLSAKDLRDQLVRTDAAIGPQRTTKSWVRPPYGSMNPLVMANITMSGRAMAMWSFDSQDYTIRQPDDLVKRCTPTAIGPGEVMLFHEEQDWTYAALPDIVARLRGAGYEFATMADLFGA
jgi:peptidoglycan-N-acetylglucosamine deacetylase